VERELSSVPLSRYSTRIVALLVLVEAVSVFFLWSLNPVSETDEGVFAILLAIDLVSLAMISNVYRSYKHSEPMNRGFLLAGCGLILVFVYVSLAL
jgi:hypothetical protein